RFGRLRYCGNLSAVPLSGADHGSDWPSDVVSPAMTGSTRSQLGQEVDYRASHAAPGYAATYAKTYETGFYRCQWETIERPLIERLLRARAEAGAESVVDFACGTGRVTEVAVPLFRTVIGVDVAPEMLAAARAR